MYEFLATAHTWRGGDGPYTIAPIAGLLLTLVLLRIVLDVRVGLALVASAALGTAFASVAESWGYTVTISVWILSTFLVGAIRRSARGAHGPNPSD